MIELSILYFVLGIMGALIIDTIWFNINYSKYERGLEQFEHYHAGILLIPFGLLINPLFLGLGLGLFIAEWEQKNKFAIKSSHFKYSTLIGGLCSALSGGLIVLWA
jgi:hypothetical protein